MKKQRKATEAKVIVSEMKNDLAKKLITAVKCLDESDFTNGFIALSKKSEEVAEIAEKLFTRRIGNVHVVDMDTVDRFNEIAVRYATKHGVMSVFVEHDRNGEWISIDILMADEKVFDTAKYIEDFDKVIPVANRNCTRQEVFEQTRINYNVA